MDKKFCVICVNDGFVFLDNNLSSEEIAKIDMIAEQFSKDKSLYISEEAICNCFIKKVHDDLGIRLNPIETVHKNIRHVFCIKKYNPVYFKSHL